MTEFEALARFHAAVAARVKRDHRDRVVAVEASLCSEDPASGQVFLYAETADDCSAYSTGFYLAHGEHFDCAGAEAAFSSAALAAIAGTPRPVVRYRKRSRLRASVVGA